MNKNNQEILLKNSELEKIKLELEKLKQKINDGNSLKSKDYMNNLMKLNKRKKKMKKKNLI